MGKVILSSVLLGALLLNTARAAPGQPLLPGDPAPALPLKERLQRGVFDTVRPVNGRLLTVIVFFASWDPLSRAVLPIIDARQAELTAQGVRFLAVAEDGPKEADLYLKQAKLKHLAVARDEGQAALGLFVDLRDGVSVPHAVLLEGSPGRLLWHGPVVEPRGKAAPTAAFDNMLRDAMEGHYDVSAAREVAACNRQLLDLQHQLCDLVNQGKVEDLRAVATPALAKDWPSGCEERVVYAFGLPGYLLAAEGEPTKESGALALELLDVALAAVARMGDTDHSLLHARACALFACGEVAEAVKIEQAVLAAPDLAPNIDEGARRLLARCGVEPAPPTGGAAPAVQTTAPAEERPAPPEMVTGEQAAQDLLALHDRLTLHYVGYDDAAWALAGEGSSWQARTEAFAHRLRSQERWDLHDLFGVLLEYLTPCRDRHFRLHSDAPGWAESARHLSPTRTLVPFFADVRVREARAERTVAEGPEAMIGAELADIPLVADPTRVALGRACLFPTLPRGPDAEYLLGVLVEDGTVPADVHVTLSHAGRREEATLPLHRGRVRLASAGDRTYRLTLDPLPVLEVRRMWGEGVEEMPPTADALRAKPAVVLDLRGNGGGNDDYGVQWCTRFTSQELRKSLGWCSYFAGETDALRRYQSLIPRASEAESRGELSLLAPARYQGKLVIVIDDAVGSAAECMVAMASQIDGALLVGENSSGCMTYGNADQRFDLPNSRLWISYPRNKDVLAGRPFREGVGFFPSYWLDTEDPVGAVSEYLKQR